MLRIFRLVGDFSSIGFYGWASVVEKPNMLNCTGGGLDGCKRFRALRTGGIFMALIFPLTHKFIYVITFIPALSPILSISNIRCWFFCYSLIFNHLFVPPQSQIAFSPNSFNNFAPSADRPPPFPQAITN